MNLQQTIESLEQNNITVALDVGVHSRCDINSNCPLAVELRRVIHDSGITLEQLLEGYTASQDAPPEPILPTLPEFNGKATISIANQTVEVDFEPTIRQQLGRAYEHKMVKLEDLEGRMRDLGRSLYSSYLNLIYELKKTKTLPQLSFESRDLISANCLITSDNTNYIFLFPRLYQPQWIVTNNVRYQIAQEDIEAIKRDAYIRIIISKERKILSVTVLDDSGYKLHHYHGDRDDCWGMVRIPERWNGSLGTLSGSVTQLMRELATINKDSLMAREPPSMPHINEVFGRSTELGEEGRTEAREEPAGDTTPRRWGQGRTRATPPPAIGGAAAEIAETPRERRIRRFGTANPSMEAACADCGEPFGDHFGADGVTCPRDH